MYLSLSLSFYLSPKSNNNYIISYHIIGLNVATLRPMFGLNVATTLRPDDVEARYVSVTTPKKNVLRGTYLMDNYSKNVVAFK